MFEQVTFNMTERDSSFLRIVTDAHNEEINSSYHQRKPRRDSAGSDIEQSRFKLGFPPISPEMKTATMPSTSSSHTQYRSTRTPSPVPTGIRHSDSDAGGSITFTNVTPSGHRMISTPMLIQDYNAGVPLTPMKHVLMENRDDGSQANNSHFDESSTFQSFVQTTVAQDQQMDEIIIQKYISEKNKVKAVEANNAMLHAHINEMNRLMETQQHETEMVKAAAITKFEDEIKKSEALELTIKQLQENLQRMEQEMSQKLTAMQDDNEKKVRMVRDEGEIKMIGLRNEMMSVQKKYGAAKSRLDQELEKSAESTKRYKALERSFEEGKVDIENEQKKSQKLQESLDHLKMEADEQDKSSTMQIKSLAKQVDDILEKYEFEKQKAEDFSLELKIMSVQYVQNLEKLEAEESKNETLVKKLDEVEAKLNVVTKKAATTNRDLEEMAKGFIETDDLLSKEGEISSQMSIAINKINVQLHNERAKSKALEEEVVTLRKSDNKNRDEATKLKNRSKSLTDELVTLKKNLSKEVSTVAELSKSLKQTEKAREVSEAKVEETQNTNKKLASEAAKFKLQSTALQNELDDVTKRWMGEKDLAEKVAAQLQEQTDAYIKLKARSTQEKNQSEEMFQEEERKIQTLTANFEGMVEKCKDQEELIHELRATLETNTERLTLLAGELERTEEIKTELEDTLEAEREENSENFQEQVDKYNLTSRELLEAEKKNALLFNNLVEIEDKLNRTKEELDVAMMQLESKDDEFRPIENMLREEIKARNKSLEEEQAKNVKLSGQNVEINKRCNQMYSNLVAAEERVLEMEQISNELKNKIVTKDQDNKNLQLSLEKEQNGPHQRKLKVAKKMIQAEKTRYRALQKEIETKDLMIKRIEGQASKLGDELKEARDQLEMEKENNASHSKRALQDMHRQLENERKDMKVEKEKLMQKVKAEKAQVKSLSIRLKSLERSTGGTDISNVLKEQHEVEEKARILMEENEKLKDAIDEKTRSEIKQEKRLEEVSKSLQDLTNYLDTMAEYCNGVEEEKNMLKKQVEAYKRNGGASSSKNNLFNLLEGDESDGDGDDDTVSGMSLSDFSVAQVPSSTSSSLRRPRPEFMNMLNRTSIMDKSTVTLLLRPSEEEIELTMDTES